MHCILETIQRKFYEFLKVRFNFEIIHKEKLIFFYLDALYKLIYEQRKVANLWIYLIKFKLKNYALTFKKIFSKVQNGDSFDSMNL